MKRFLCMLSMTGFLSAGLIALPAGCERHERTTKVEYHSPHSDRELKIQKKTEYDNNGSKTEFKTKVEHDRD